MSSLQTSNGTLYSNIFFVVHLLKMLQLAEPNVLFSMQMLKALSWGKARETNAHMF